MKVVLLIDFGSTFTKVTAVDMDKEEVVVDSVTKIRLDDGVVTNVMLSPKLTPNTEYQLPADQYRSSNPNSSISGIDLASRRSIQI